jgi:hypothetical protein
MITLSADPEGMACWAADGDASSGDAVPRIGECGRGICLWVWEKGVNRWNCGLNVSATQSVSVFDRNEN